MSEQKKPMGRPRKRPIDPTRRTITSSVPGEVYGKLLADAEARGATLSGQIEYIIQQWYDQPALIDALADRLEQRRADIFADRHPKQTYGVRMYDSSEINAG